VMQNLLLQLAEWCICSCRTRGTCRQISAVCQSKLVYHAAWVQEKGCIFGLKDFMFIWVGCRMAVVWNWWDTSPLHRAPNTSRTALSFSLFPWQVNSITKLPCRR
jgi:hypothetical protein